MSYDRTIKPDPLEFYQDTEGLVLQPGKTWRQTSCRFCNSKDNLAINVEDGGFHCWGCLVNGGDVIEYYRQAHDASFEEACRALGCWVESEKPKRKKPKINASQALKELYQELLIGYIVLCDLRAGKQPPGCDVDRLGETISRVGVVLEGCHG